MALSREDVLHIARLARVAMTEADIERMREQLSHILENFEILRQVATEDVPPTGHAIALQNVMRPDTVLPSYPPEAVLANAPDREDDFFRVRAVLEF
ncbi:MAG: Asp-tRNA(Asn)/Glu-tRNA(Gln) amidotransferase subunit GatC [Chloroflexi bacterium]|nr:Asp-tRNA(Asn)/Glu-tRNA(Gln) amidotransferase subunit GatC [Chloroflexota bacterium]